MGRGGSISSRHMGDFRFSISHFALQVQTQGLEIGDFEARVLRILPPFDAVIHINILTWRIENVSSWHAHKGTKLLFATMSELNQDRKWLLEVDPARRPNFSSRSTDFEWRKKLKGILSLRKKGISVFGGKKPLKIRQCIVATTRTSRKLASRVSKKRVPKYDTFPLLSRLFNRCELCLGRRGVKRARICRGWKRGSRKGQRLSQR